MTAGPRALAEPDQRGRVFELAVGAELLQLPGELFYWREKNLEVDFVYRHLGSLYAIAVESGRRKSAKGLEAFVRHFPDAHPVTVTLDNFPMLSADPQRFMAALN